MFYRNLEAGSSALRGSELGGEGGVVREVLFP